MCCPFPLSAIRDTILIRPAKLCSAICPPMAYLLRLGVTVAILQAVSGSCNTWQIRQFHRFAQFRHFSHENGHGQGRESWRICFSALAARHLALETGRLRPCERLAACGLRLAFWIPAFAGMTSKGCSPWPMPLLASETPWNRVFGPPGAFCRSYFVCRSRFLPSQE